MQKEEMGYTSKRFLVCGNIYPIKKSEQQLCSFTGFKDTVVGDLPSVHQIELF